MYTPIKLDISTDQHEKLKKAVQQKKAVSMKVNVNGSGKKNKYTFLLTHSQQQRLERARLIGKPTANIRLSKKQVMANMEHRGGFLGTLLGLASKFAPTLLGGLATGLISGGIERAVSGRGLHSHPTSSTRRGGDGLYLHKSGHSLKITPIRGRGIKLMPRKLHGVNGDGLYLKRGVHIYDGRGLLLGKNSPFKNIPLLNLLL